MTGAATASQASFVDRRDSRMTASPPAGVERRQFTNSHDDLSPRARELAMAIDQYKLCHRRRFITYEEMLYIIEELGYRKAESHSNLSDGQVAVSS